MNSSMHGYGMSWRAKILYKRRSARPGPPAMANAAQAFPARLRHTKPLSLPKNERFGVSQPAFQAAVGTTVLSKKKVRGICVQEIIQTLIELQHRFIASDHFL